MKFQLIGIRFCGKCDSRRSEKIYTANQSLQLRKCYETIVRLDNKLQDTFRIVIDVETHEVIKTEKLH